MALWFKLAGIGRETLLLLIGRRQDAFPGKKIVLVYGIPKEHQPPHNSIASLASFLEKTLARFVDSKFKETRFAFISDFELPTSFFKRDFKNAHWTSYTFIELAIRVIGKDRNARRCLAILIIRLLRGAFETISVAKSFRGVLSSLDIIALEFLQSKLAIEILGVVTTTSHWWNWPKIFTDLEKRQPAIEKIMIHYAENTWSYDQEKYLFGFAPIDVHLTSTESYAAELKHSFPGSKVLHCGSLMFRPFVNEPVDSRELSPGTTRVLYFDITPRLGTSECAPYSSENAMKSLRILVEAIQISESTSDSVYLCLKQKRVPGKDADKNYLIYISNLVNAGVLNLVEPTDDIYSLVKHSKIVLCTIGTTAAVVAFELGVPVAYIDVREINLSTPSRLPKSIPILRSVNDISKFICGVLENMD